MKIIQRKELTVFQSPIYQTNSTVIEGKRFLLIVDPTWLPHEVEEIRAYVEEIRGDRSLYILFTHGDFDHILGAGLFPDAITIGSKRLDQHPEKEEVLEQVRKFDDKYYLQRTYPIQFPEIDHLITCDGQQLEIGEAVLTFHTAPGHTADGIITYVEPYGIWIVGDYLSDVEIPYVYDSIVGYEETLDKAKKWLQLVKKTVQWLIPGHGTPTNQVDQMKQRIHFAEEYLQGLRKGVIENNTELLESLYNKVMFPSDFTRSAHEGNIEKMKEDILK